ncbi:hypothetical protein CVT26_015845 [Gymnopilus dilepis]|uniref:Uncharacterized protein n=1 Tax=Gymnopilus dilepis TaxID=231916 RepID=A0A409XYA2_9AGAR|nr:hypothetical protein CVT26_015845 [Gymnopilus dilepis]
MVVLLSLLLLSPRIAAFPVNTTIAELQQSRVDLVAEAAANHLQSRSIWDILWSCLATIFVCSWVSVHPNIPPVEEGFWKVFLRRLELMMWSIVAPTMMILWAARQWIAAKTLTKMYQDRFPNSGWTKTHSYFIQMGGFVLYDGARPLEVILDPDKMDILLRKGLIKFPDTTEEEITDRTRGDGLSKALVICQTVWFGIQCLGRKIEGLPITQLELVTAGLAFLNGTMYFLWWKKPLGVRLPIPVYTLRHVENKEGLFENDAHFSEKGVEDIGKFFTRIFLHLDKQPSIKVGNSTEPIDIRGTIFQGSILTPIFQRVKQMVDSNKPGDTFYAYTQFGQENRVAIFTDVIGLTFGAIHCAGWNFMFPTHAELMIWRASSSIVIGIPMLMMLISLMVRTLRRRSCLPQKPSSAKLSIIPQVIRVLMFILIPAYLLTRLALVIEAFVTLRKLPPGAYEEVAWLSFFPHI